MSVRLARILGIVLLAPAVLAGAAWCSGSCCLPDSSPGQSPAALVASDCCGDSPGGCEPTLVQLDQASPAVFAPHQPALALLTFVPNEFASAAALHEPTSVVGRRSAFAPPLPPPLRI
jgi:hypothetical protein